MNFHIRDANSGSIKVQTGKYSSTTKPARSMSRIIRSGLIQMSLPKTEGEGTIPEIIDAMVQKHIPFIEEAGRKGVQILCLQEIFNTPYFCPGQDKAWYASAEPVPGPTTMLMQEYARKFGMVIIVPLYEKEQSGVLYNTAAVIDADGTYLGKYRKNHIPHTGGFWEKFFFKPGNLGYPVFQTQFAKVGVYICYDRHFPDGARCLGLNGAEIVYNPSATTVGQSQYLWKLEQPAHAVANGYFMGCINRVGEERPWNLGRFYGTSYFVDPRGQILAEASEFDDELLVAELNLDQIDEVRSVWQFYRDRRPETYGPITQP
jgi:N-carbamoylputrescine amidase